MSEFIRQLDNAVNGQPVDLRDFHRAISELIDAHNDAILSQFDPLQLEIVRKNTAKQNTDVCADDTKAPVE